MHIIPVDCHTHSNLSFDGDDSPKAMIESAISRGIKHYALTDHVEIDTFYEPEYNFEANLKKASEILPELKKEYAGRINFIYGVELGQPLHNIELTTKILANNDYDFIIGSCHAVRGFRDFFFLDYTKTDPETILRQYFEEMLEMSEWGGFDVLGHITYPLRYIFGEYGIKVDMTQFKGIVEKILRTIIKNNMGIEINTSGLRQKIKTTLPDLSYVKLYKKLGGEIITVGSDAHSANDTGADIDKGIEVAKEAGFGEIWYFEKRQPKFIKI